MTFRVGQKVVCIKYDTWRDALPEEACPQLDCVYTIRSIECRARGYFLRFEEIRNPTMVYAEGRGEASFHIRHFRPIVERKIDISIFTKMLTPQGVDA